MRAGIVLANCTPGEITFLALTSYFDRSVIAGWASGTGAAGLVGAFSYAALTAFLSPRTTLYALAGVPLLIPLACARSLLLLSFSLRSFS